MYLGGFFIILLTGWFGGCTTQAELPPSVTAVTTNTEQNIGENMINDSLDIRLQRRDTSPLPAGVVLKFQAINRGKNPKYNYRWLLYEDGRWFLAKHSGDTSDWQTPFDTDLPTTPTHQLSADVIHDVLAQLEAVNFLAQPAYQVDDSVEDGSFYIITARLNDTEHEVIYEGIDNQLVEFLNDLTYANQ